MIDALISGRLYGRPEQRTGKGGKPFTTAKVLVPSENEERVFCNVIAFDETVQTGLLALDDGDTVALAGMLTPKVFETKNGAVKPALDMVAHGLLTPYHVRRKRQAQHPETSGNVGSSADGMDDL